MAISKRKSSKPKTVIAILLLIVIIVYVGLCLWLPLKALTAAKSASVFNVTTPVSSLPWPNYGEAAVGLASGQVVQTHGQQKPLPTASVAKLITALAVLKKYPLSVGQSGPIITIDATDYAIYGQYIAEQGSIVPVSVGEKLSELNMLEAMLVPSGDNIADALARWAYGSLTNYQNYANTFVKQLGLNNTHIGVDASGYSPTTTSTPRDLIKIGADVMANPVLAQIVNMKSVNVPNVGVLNNYDNQLGVDGIIGIKTGNSNQAGGVFLGAETTKINNKVITLLTAIMGAPTLTQALSGTRPLAVALENDFSESVLISKGEVLGEFTQPWGGTIQIAAKNNLSSYGLLGQSQPIYLEINPLKLPANAGKTIGSISSPANQLNSFRSVPLVIVQTPTKPSWLWRILHPNNIF